MDKITDIDRYVTRIATAVEDHVRLDDENATMDAIRSGVSQELSRIYSEYRRGTRKIKEYRDFKIMQEPVYQLRVMDELIRRAHP